MKRVLVVVDPEALEDSLHLVRVGERMYGADSATSYALGLEEAWQHAGDFFDYVFRPRRGGLHSWDTAAVARCIDSLHSEYQFDAIVIPATHCGRMIAPRAAARVHTGLVADVTDVETDGTSVLMVRPAFSGRLLAAIAVTGNGPIMMTVRPRAFGSAYARSESGGFLDFDVSDIPSSGVRLIERRDKPARDDIRESEVLISGGGGVVRDFPLLERLAEALDGMVAASRKAVDTGHAPRQIQVGQSGKFVSPRLYIALGISGASPHVAGLRSAQYVIAVNTNRQAPICSIADVVVEGDATAFVKQILNRIDTSHTTNHGGTS